MILTFVYTVVYGIPTLLSGYNVNHPSPCRVGHLLPCPTPHALLGIALCPLGEGVICPEHRASDGGLCRLQHQPESPAELLPRALELALLQSSNRPCPAIRSPISAESLAQASFFRILYTASACPWRYAGSPEGS